MNKAPQKAAAPKIPTNDYAAEQAAGVAAASVAPNPLITMTLADPAALDNVRRRVAQVKAARGRSSLRIPLSSTVGVSGGISIPT